MLASVDLWIDRPIGLQLMCKASAGLCSELCDNITKNAIWLQWTQCRMYVLEILACSWAEVGLSTLIAFKRSSGYIVGRYVYRPKPWISNNADVDKPKLISDQVKWMILVASVTICLNGVITNNAIEISDVGLILLGSWPCIYDGLWLMRVRHRGVFLSFTSRNNIGCLKLSRPRSLTLQIRLVSGRRVERNLWREVGLHRPFYDEAGSRTLIFAISYAFWHFAAFWNKKILQIKFYKGPLLTKNLLFKYLFI